jgi:hypothetical protein
MLSSGGGSLVGQIQITPRAALKMVRKRRRAMTHIGNFSGSMPRQERITDFSVSAIARG